MTKKQKILGAGGVAAAILVGYFVYQNIVYVSTDNAQIEAHAVLLASKVGGFITKVDVEEGQRVKKGDVLVEIDSRDYQNTLNQMKGELTSVEAQKNDAEKNFSRNESLFHGGAVSRAQYDTASASLAGIKARYESLTAQVAQAQLNLENTKILAPSDGLIAKKSAEVGQLAAPGVPLIGFVDATERWVIANFKETEVGDIKIGAVADLDVDALSGSYKGKVVAISSATGATFTLLPPDNATGNFTKVVQRVPVKIQFDSLTEKDVENLRAGLSVNVKVRKH